MIARFIAVFFSAFLIVGVAQAASKAPTAAGFWEQSDDKGVVGGWFLFGIIGAAVAVFYLAGPRKRLNAGEYSGRY